jgi:MYXO-CTERM domain-containing protein
MSRRITKYGQAALVLSIAWATPALVEAQDVRDTDRRVVDDGDDNDFGWIGLLGLAGLAGLLRREKAVGTYRSAPVGS